MKKNISLWQFSGFATVSLLGTLLHYLYEWSGKNRFIAAFSGINESTWEHMKLLYFPLLIFAIIQSFFFKDRKDFWCVKLAGIIIGLTLIPVIFYTYNGILGKSPDWINIVIFFISAASAFIAETRFFRKNAFTCKHKWLAIACIIAIGVLFVIFTYFTPDIPLFEPPKKS